MDVKRMSDIAAVKEMLKQYAKVCNTGDLNHWISLWADNGVQMPPDTPTRIGKEQIREGMKPMFDARAQHQPSWNQEKSARLKCLHKSISMFHNR